MTSVVAAASMAALWGRRAAWAAAALVTVWALAWVAVPPLLKAQLEARGSEALGRKLTVGAIEFQPWTLELTVRDLAMASADGSFTQFKLPRLSVDAELQSLLRLAPVVDAVTVEAPQLRVTHLGAGHYDVDDIVGRLKQPSDKPASAPLRFALHNLVLQGGEVDFTDRTAAGERRHTLRKLHLAVPFLSNLDSQREVTVFPRLAFELNGSTFDSAAQGTPFAQTRKGEVTLRIAGFDTAPYLSYLPAGLPVQLRSALLDADLKIGFVQGPKAGVTVSGALAVSQLRLADGAGKDFLDVDRMAAVLADVRPLEQVAKLASLDVIAPVLQASRNRAGRLSPAFSADAARAGGVHGTRPEGQEAAAGGWQVELLRLGLQRGAVAWRDDSTTPMARVRVADLELQAQGLQWPFVDKVAAFEGRLAVLRQGVPASLAFKGEGTDSAGRVHATLHDLALEVAGPYVAPFLVPQVAGVLDGELNAQWHGSQVQLALQRLAVRNLALLADQAAGLAPQSALPQCRLLEVTDAQIDLSIRTVRIGKVALRAPQATVARDAQGQWMFERWLPAATTSTAVAPQNAVPTPPWRISVAEALLDDGTVRFDDRTPSKPVAATLSALRLQMKSLTLDGKKPAPLTVSAKVQAGQTEPGTFKYTGTVMWDPVVVQGAVEAMDVPAHAFAPYAADRVPVELLRADASVKGTVRYATTPLGPEVQVRVDAALEEFRANSMPSRGAQRLPVGEELLSWKSLNVPGIALDMAPGGPARVQVREAALSDFYARLLVSPEGRLNLQDLAVGDAAPVASPSPTPVMPAPPVVAIGPISLVHGRVLFSDRFVKPNYSADLTELTGKLGKFSSESTDGVVQLADLELRGRAEGSALLEITGKVNPLAKPLALDIQGRVRDLELPPLSPYAIKYAGYGIERGKLSVDVGYRIKPDGQLTASNQIVLNQLSFGEKVEGAPASLPVKLAVSLLADRHGVIDLNLPISGSLNDPQFSVGPILWKVVTNLITKALTAPFSLLAHALGGDEELRSVAFAGGSSALSTEAKAGLDKVAKALGERTSLQVTVLGMASLELERDALQRERLRGLLLAEKRRRAAVAGQDTAAVAPVSDADYAVLLKEVYKRADITKPRNLIGLAKDLPNADMEALLLASIVVNEDSMRELALSRGVAVRDYLATHNLTTDRLFLGAARTGATEPGWKPRAELNLSSP